MTLDFDTTRAARIRAALATAGFATEAEENSETSFVVLLPVDNTRLSVGSANGTVTVGRAMPSGNISGQVVFTNIPTDVIAVAVLAMAQSLND